MWVTGALAFTDREMPLGQYARECDPLNSGGGSGGVDALYTIHTMCSYSTS